MRCRKGLPSAPVPNHTGTPQMDSMPSASSFCSTRSTSSSTRATSAAVVTRANTMQPLTCRNAYCVGVMVSRSLKRVPMGSSLASLRASERRQGQQVRLVERRRLVVEDAGRRRWQV
jgi:hypothetical protein